MDDSHQIPLIFYGLALFAIVSFVYNLRRFLVIRKGKKESHRSFSFWKILSNFLVYGLGQRRVFRLRFSYASTMHFLLGWGFIELFFATTVDFFLARGWFSGLLPGKDVVWFAAINDLGGLMVFAGLAMALYRRLIGNHSPLETNHFRGENKLLGDTGILLLLLILVFSGFLSEAARLSIEKPFTASASFIGYRISLIISAETWKLINPVLWWSHALASLGFIAILPLTKMFHVLAVLVNVALTDQTRRGVIQPMHVSKLMEDPDVDIDNLTLGVGHVNDLTWKQQLDSISCTDCARCTSVCPAYEIGTPLSPMNIITTIQNQLYNHKNSDSPGPDLVGGLVTESALWSCTTCAACMEVCPVFIDHVPTFTDLRRFLVLSEGKPPTQAGEHLENMMNSGNPWGFSSQDRLKWAEGLDLPVMAEKKETDILYWVGCAGAYDPRNQQISKALVKIFREAEIDFAVLGSEETCTGDSARRLGDEYLFETLAIQNIEILNRYSFKSIVTPCPHCFHTLKNEYQDFGGKYKVMHHSQFIENLIVNHKITPRKYNPDKLTYHDACYLGRHNGEYEAPRNLLKSILEDGNDLIEMPRARADSFCCGAGGGNMWHEIQEGDRMNLARFDEAIKTKAQTVATSCSYCMIMMDDAMKVKSMDESMKVLDVAELVAEGL